MLTMSKFLWIDNSVRVCVRYTYDDGYGKISGIQGRWIDDYRGTASSGSIQQCYIESGGKSIFVKVNFYRSDYGWVTKSGRIYG